MNIKQEFERRKQNVSDINEHLETLHNYGRECNHITEFGSRFGDSTVALLYSSPEKMISYDLFKSDFIAEIDNKNFSFVQEDTLNISIEETDLLFIDTLHRYFQLYNELGLHAKKVKKYIILHDTETYGIIDEPLYSPLADVKMSQKILSTNKQGLLHAVEDFLNETKEGKNWEIKEQFKNNNGLTILSRR